MSPRLPLILVVGMHRSGTSLLGSILQSLGVAMPGDLIAGDIHNPEGYFERADITALQEELLIDLQRWWPSEHGLKQLPVGWLSTPRAQRSAACLKRLLQTDQAAQTLSWAIKDPRTSLLLPLWRQVAGELALPLKLLLAVRDPAEVVVSLVGRDGGPAGMTPARAQGLWLRHHQQLLADGNGLPLQVLSYSRWFSNPAAQIRALGEFCNGASPSPEALAQAMACIRPTHRRSKAAASEVRLQRAVRRWHHQLEQAASSCRSDALQRWAQRQQPQPMPRDACLHPWQPALSALGADTPATLAAGLQHWQTQGIPALSLNQLKALRRPGLPGDDPSRGDGLPLPPQQHLEWIGAEPQAWHNQLWLELLPLAPATDPAPSEPPAAALHLQPIEHTAADPALLLRLSQIPRVFDPDPEQVRLLRLFGVPAEPLGAAFRTNQTTANDPLNQASQQLGLPNPAALAALGSRWLCLGSSCEAGWLTPPPELLHVPAIPPAPALSPEQGRLQAAWIAACRQQGLQLVRLNPEPAELPLWRHLAVPCFSDPIDPQELLEELAWQEAGRPPEPAIHTPSPEHTVLWSHESSTTATAAICISSFNYADRLPAALESCRVQSLSALELVIVDDASSDASPELCRRWLEQHGSRFCRVRLLQHRSNGGLAAARNTAFAAASAPWCFVLDADNTLDPEALAHSLAIATGSPASTAVVHPLIRICDDRDQPHGLVGGGHAWQQEQLQAGNMVDAMALVRRGAWQAVGGYSHIPGGWEDFDFWCKLIAAGHHGVLCPQVLATYRQHGDSMLQSQTNRRQRRLSRLLQQRHPWLQLEMARPNR
jgi:GT2 family glycosyltransferase